MSAIRIPLPPPCNFILDRVGAQRPEPGDRHPQCDDPFLGPRARDRTRLGPTMSSPFGLKMAFVKGASLPRVRAEWATVYFAPCFLLSPALARRLACKTHKINSFPPNSRVREFNPGSITPLFTLFYSCGWLCGLHIRKQYSMFARRQVLNYLDLLHTSRSCAVCMPSGLFVCGLCFVDQLRGCRGLPTRGQGGATEDVYAAGPKS